MRVWGLYVRYRTERPAPKAPPKVEDVPVRKGRLMLRPGEVYHCRVCAHLHSMTEAVALRHEPYVERVEGIRPRAPEDEL